jgi:very-short-patch-repair endonuclease
MGRIQRARQLRREMSPAEAALWQYLRTPPSGLKFRRQKPFGPYYLDFYCRSAAVDIEVDGDVHDMGDNPARDERRDAWLATHGVLTLRFLAGDIFNELENVARQIEEVCAARTPLHRASRGPPPRQRPGRSSGA